VQLNKSLLGPKLWNEAKIVSDLAPKLTKSKMAPKFKMPRDDFYQFSDFGILDLVCDV
jgi:hypothetical protein